MKLLLRILAAIALGIGAGYVMPYLSLIHI